MNNEIDIDSSTYWCHLFFMAAFFYYPSISIYQSSFNSYLSGFHMIHTHSLFILNELQIWYGWPIILKPQSSCMSYRCDIIGHPYATSSYPIRVTNVVWLANIISTIARNDSLAVLVYICILPDSRFLGTKKILGVSLDQ